MYLKKKKISFSPLPHFGPLAFFPYARPPAQPRASLLSPSPAFLLGRPSTARINRRRSLGPSRLATAAASSSAHHPLTVRARASALSPSSRLHRASLTASPQLPLRAHVRVVGASPRARPLQKRAEPFPAPPAASPLPFHTRSSRGSQTPPRRRWPWFAIRPSAWSAVPESSPPPFFPW